jgi:hypothetical protein
MTKIWPTDLPPQRRRGDRGERHGGLLVRVGPEQSEKLDSSTKAAVAVTRGRPMPGWLRVDAWDVRTQRQLSKWA